MVREQPIRVTRFRSRGRLAAAGRVLETVAGLALLFSFWPFSLLRPFTQAVFGRVGWWRSPERELHRGRPTVLRVARDAVVGDGVHIARSEVRDGWLEPSAAGRHMVVASLARGREIFAEVETETEALRLLEALGIAPADHAARFPLASKLVASGMRLAGHVVMAFFLTVFAAGAWTTPFTRDEGKPFWGAIPLALIITVALWRWASRTALRGSVTVGSDGLLVRRGGKERYVSYREVVDWPRLETTSQGIHEVVVPTRVGGERLPVGNVVDDERALAHALCMRLQHAVASFGQRGASVDLGVLDRQGRSFADWRRALAELRGPHYRRIAVQDDQLLHLVADDQAPRERRVAAALTLLDGGDPAHREAVARARQRTAHPRMRIVLDQALRGELDDQAMEEALAEEEYAVQSA